MTIFHCKFGKSVLLGKSEHNIGVGASRPKFWPCPLLTVALGKLSSFFAYQIGGCRDI